MNRVYAYDVYDSKVCPTLWVHKLSGSEKLLALLVDSYYNKREEPTMKQTNRICIGGHTGVRWSGGLAYSVCTLVPDMDGFWNVRIWRVNGADMTELTEQVNQTALREALTQVQSQTCAAFAAAAFRWIRSATKSSRCIMTRRPSLISVRLNFVYNGNGWVHDLKNGSEILDSAG